MRILLLNPNTSEAMTVRMAAVARASVPPGVEIETSTAPRGVPYIATRAEAQIAGAIALETIAARSRDVDAVVIAAFGDPGVGAARELFDLPVVGLAEAAVHAAALLGERFVIVTFTPLMSRWYLDCVEGTGLGARCAGVLTPPRQALDVERAAETLGGELASLARRAVSEHGADVVIPGGAPLAGLAGTLQGTVPAILVDPVAAAVGQAALLARLASPEAFRNRSARSAPKPSTGLDPTLAAVLADERER